MSKLIGTGPNQVPSNADLGDMAYQDSDVVTVGQLNLNNGAQSRIHFETTWPDAKHWSITNEGNVNRLRFMYTDDNKDTNAEPTMYLTTDKRLGIGAAPDATLHVESVIGEYGGTGNTPDFPVIIAQNDLDNTINQTGGSGVGILFKNASNSIPKTGAAIASIKQTGDDDNSSADLAFYTSDNDDTLDETARLTTRGDFGLGTIAPNVSPAGTFTWASPISAVSGSRPTLYLNGTGTITTIRMWPSASDGSSTTLDDWHINAVSNSSGGFLTFAPQGGSIAPAGLYLKNDGKVGIGVSSPDAKLEIANGSTLFPALHIKGSNGSSTANEGIGAGPWILLDNTASATTTGYPKTAGIVYQASNADNGWNFNNNEDYAFLKFSRTNVPSNNATQIEFGTQSGSGASETRLTVDPSGWIGVGTTTPQRKFTIYEDYNSNTLYNTLMRLQRHYSDIDGSGTLGQSNMIEFLMTDGNATFTPQVRIGMVSGDYETDGGIPSEGNGNFIIETSRGTDSVGNGTIAERFRVNEYGNVGIGISKPNTRLHIKYDDTTVTDGIIIDQESNGNYAGIRFVDVVGDTNSQYGVIRFSHSDGQSTTLLGSTFSSHHLIGTTETNHAIAFTTGASGNSAGTARGSITFTSGGTTYNTTSDIRLKDNISAIKNGKDIVLAMNPVTHTWKEDPSSETVHGFIAQEMQNIIPEAVSGDPEGEAMMSMDYGRITPVIVAALQDALKEIEKLKTRIQDLENQ